VFEQSLQSSIDIRQLIQDCVQLSRYNSSNSSSSAEPHGNTNTKSSDVCEVQIDVAAAVSQCIQTAPVLIAAALQCALSVMLKYAQPHMTVRFYACSNSTSYCTFVASL
jgi:hypothetical protein